LLVFLVVATVYLLIKGGLHPVWISFLGQKEA
jgi:hypothetical protein